VFSHRGVGMWKSSGMGLEPGRKQDGKGWGCGKIGLGGEQGWGEQKVGFIRGSFHWACLTKGDLVNWNHGPPS